MGKLFLHVEKTTKHTYKYTWKLLPCFEDNVIIEEFGRKWRRNFKEVKVPQKTHEINK